MNINTINRYIKTIENNNLIMVYHNNVLNMVYHIPAKKLYTTTINYNKSSCIDFIKMLPAATKVILISDMKIIYNLINLKGA